ncbi:hypothetical protein C7974DRAFT_414564 [Boeremia exigua]|uniref:uncharacterized protein n=1 Tax=Boeremia exigua TaxID=749465 RepID=UPI001E8EAAA1|nr:uncharacterized protein C7974DRAFT_414564 [Boeremia exigua]KAH6621881.1 hypothetical protein C7974DRAFT_414564 [Boeremia exigua]
MSAPTTDASNGLLSPPRSPREGTSAPYPVGQSFCVKRHTPVIPFGRNYCESEDDEPPSVVPEDVSQLDWCVAHPPCAGKTDTSVTRDIIFKAPIRTGDQCGAQVMLTEDGFVAKIYDPLYYSFGYDDLDRKIDVSAEADYDYTIETYAYSALSESGLQGSVMPKFYGSWTMEVRTSTDGQQCLREVRLILLEHITGTAMLNIKPKNLGKEEKEAVMRKVIEAETDLRIAGLEHDDFEPRNIMLSTFTKSSANTPHHVSFDSLDLRVCVIDYGRSFVRVGPTYRNPLFRWAGDDIYSMYGWLPRRKEATDWMWKVWGNGGQDGKYVVAEKNPKSILGRPVRRSVI